MTSWTLQLAYLSPRQGLTAVLVAYFKFNAPLKYLSIQSNSLSNVHVMQGVLLIAYITEYMLQWPFDLHQSSCTSLWTTQSLRHGSFGMHTFRKG